MREREREREITFLCGKNMHKMGESDKFMEIKKIRIRKSPNKGR